MAIAFVQKNGVTDSVTGVTSQALAFTSNNTAGNFIVVCVNAYGGAVTSIAVSDSKSNTYATAVGPTSFNIGTIQGMQRMFYATNIAAGANTVTATISPSNLLDLSISEFSGVATSSPVDVTDTNSNASSATITSNSFTTSVNGELLISFCIASSSSGVGTGFTELSSLDGDEFEYQIQSAAGATTATCSSSSTQAWQIMTAAFKPPVSAVTSHFLCLLGCGA